MKLDLSEIVRTAGMRYRYDIDEPCMEEEGVKCTEPVRGYIDFANTGRALIAKGKVETTLQLDCSRCLASFTMPVTSEIDEQFLIPHILEEHEEEGEDEEELELKAEQEALFSDDTLDLSELIRQNLIVSTPIRPLCKEACKGLCVACGQNLNEAECDCDRATVSGAFANLAELWEKRQAESD